MSASLFVVAADDAGTCRLGKEQAELDIAAK
jgi:hypothetical protein